MHGVHDQQDGHAAIEQSEVAHHAKNRLLLGAFDMGGADEFGATPEFRARARRHDFGDCLAPPDKRAGIGLEAGSGFDRHGFTGEHRLVNEDGSIDQSNIGRDDGAERQLDHVALYQFGRR